MTLTYTTMLFLRFSYRAMRVLPCSSSKLTPPLDCGLLDGILRREMLETGACEEAVLTPADLETADEVLFGRLKNLERLSARELTAAG